jgi:hypothetical protein
MVNQPNQSESLIEASSALFTTSDENIESEMLQTNNTNM